MLEYECFDLPGPNSINVWTSGDYDIMNLFKPEVRRMPKLAQLISKGLGRDGLVWLKLPRPEASASQSLAWCRGRITRILNEGPQVYKIGITTDPLLRFYKQPTSTSQSPGYYYAKEKFKCMHVIFGATSWDAAALMEAALIESHQHKPGNRNVRPGVKEEM